MHTQKRVKVIKQTQIFSSQNLIYCGYIILDKYKM